MTEDEARLAGHPPVAQGVVCVDFDGTIAPWGDLFGYPEPLPGALDFMRWLKEKGYTVYIFTSRLSSVWHRAEGRDPGYGVWEQVEYLRKYCEKYGIDVDGATAEKIPAIAYIDDKAVEFLDWTQASSRFKRKVLDGEPPAPAKPKRKRRPTYIDEEGNRRTDYSQEAQ